MPVRTIEIELFNETPFPLQQSAANLCHGDWRPTGMPPATIAPGSSGKIRAESDGIATGTGGYVKYKARAAPESDANGNPLVTNTATIYWSNPYIGTTVIHRDCRVQFPVKCDEGVQIPPGTVLPPIPPLYELVQRSTSDGPNPFSDKWGEFVLQAVIPPGEVAGTYMDGWE